MKHIFYYKGIYLALYIDIIAAPLSGKSALVRDKNNRIKCFLKSAPEKGKANKEIIALLADLLKISQKSISIIAGQTDKKKRICIDTTITLDEFCNRCGIALQITMHAGG